MPSVAGAVPKAGGPQEFSLRTPIRAPPPGTDLEQFRRYVENRMDQMENNVKLIQDGQLDDHQGAAQWRARHEQLHAVQEHRVNLIDARIVGVESTLTKAAEQIQMMEKFTLDLGVQTLKQRLEKFAGDIEKAFDDVHQVEMDLSNHIGTIGETYGQMNNQMSILKQSVDAHATQIAWNSTHTSNQLNLAAEKVGGLEGRVSSMAHSHGSSSASITPPGLPGGAMAQAFQGGKCHCPHVDQLTIEVANSKKDIQNLSSLSGYVTVCQSLDARIKALEDLMNTVGSPSKVQADPQAHGNDDWTKYLHGAHQPGDHGAGAGHPGGSYGSGYGGYGSGPGQPSWGTGGPGGDGGPGGGGGGFPGGGGQWPRLPPSSGGINLWNLDRVFDDKVAMSSDHAYDGNAHGEKWRIKVEGYWIGKLPPLMEVLDWTVNQDTKPISKSSLELERQDAVNTGRWKPALTDDVLDRINGLIWGFLNLCLKGEAHRLFMMAERLNGLEGWRMVIGSIRRGRDNHQAQLRELVKHPPRINKLEDVEMGITNFDSLLRDYVAVGGSPPNDLEKKSDFLSMLPGEIRDNLIWKSNDPTKSYEEFRDHVKAQANYVLFHRGKLKGQINSVVTPPEPEKPADDEDQMEERIVAAIFKRMGKGGGKGGGGGGDRGRADGGDRPQDA